MILKMREFTNAKKKKKEDIKKKKTKKKHASRSTARTFRDSDPQIARLLIIFEKRLFEDLS